MSPEQAAGRDADARSDVYAVAVVLYEMLTGRPPFHGDDIFQILGKHINEPVVPPRDAAPGADIPEPVEDLLLRALSKDPSERYPDMAELEAAIQSVAFEFTAMTVMPPAYDDAAPTTVWDAERGRRAREAASLGVPAATPVDARMVRPSAAVHELAPRATPVASTRTEPQTLPPLHGPWVPNPVTAENATAGAEGIPTAEVALAVPKHAPSRTVVGILIVAVAVVMIAAGFATWSLYNLTIAIEY